MTWEYRQKTGELIHDGRKIGTCYSGHGLGLNNPDMEVDADVGPIPRGKWIIGPFTGDHPHLGPFVAALTPTGHNAHGRTAFFCHGDNGLRNQTASHGCIVAARDIRVAMGVSNDHDLNVVT